MPEATHLDDQEPKLRKVQFTVDEDTVQKLQNVKSMNHDPSLAQSFRRATALAEFFGKLTKDGYEVLVKKGDDTFKILMP